MLSLLQSLLSARKQWGRRVSHYKKEILHSRPTKPFGRVVQNDKLYSNEILTTRYYAQKFMSSCLGYFIEILVLTSHPPFCLLYNYCYKNRFPNEVRMAVDYIPFVIHVVKSSWQACPQQAGNLNLNFSRTCFFTFIYTLPSPRLS